MGEASSRTSYELAALLTKVAVLCFPPRPPNDTVSQQNDHFGHNSTRFGAAGRAAAAVAAADDDYARVRVEGNNGMKNQDKEKEDEEGEDYEKWGHGQAPHFDSLMEDVLAVVGAPPAGAPEGPSPEENVEERSKCNLVLRQTTPYY